MDRSGDGANEPTRSGRIGLLLAVPAVAFLALFFFYPVVEILLRSVTEPTLGLENYAGFFGNAVYVTVLRRTLTVSVLVTLLVLVVGYPYAYLMTVASPRFRLTLLIAVTLPFWISLLVRNYAWIVLLQDGGVVSDLLNAIGLGRVQLIGTSAGVTIGMTQILLPFAVLPLFATMLRVDPLLLRAAESLGAGPRRAFLRVYLPLTMPGVVAAGTLVFILCLGFYITPALLGSPQNAFLAQLIFLNVSQLLDWGSGGAMAAVLVAVAVVLLTGCAWALKRARLSLTDMKLT